jgi:hypothetical protein
LHHAGDLHLGRGQAVGILHPLIQGGEHRLDGAERALFTAGHAVGVGQIRGDGVEAYRLGRIALPAIS